MFFQTICCKPISKIFSKILNVEFWSSLIPTQVLFFPPSDFPATPSHVHTSEVQSDVNAVTSISGNWHNGPPTMPTHMLVRREDVKARKPSDKGCFSGCWRPQYRAALVCTRHTVRAQVSLGHWLRRVNSGYGHPVLLSGQRTPGRPMVSPWDTSDQHQDTM